MIIRKVWQAKSNGTKYITIPKNCNINAGDYVKLIRIIEPNCEYETETIEYDNSKFGNTN